MSGVFIVAAKRTPFGAFGGLLKNVSATHLGVVSTQAALTQAENLDPAAVDACYFGNVIQSSSDAAYLARHVALQSGCNSSVPSLTINRLCGSGFESVIQGYKSIQLQEASIAICGGAENMSMAPLVADGHLARFGTTLGQALSLRDALWDGLTDSHIKTPMGVTAENLAQMYNITRQDCDEFALLSQSRWKDAHDAGLFAHEMAPVGVPGKGGAAVAVDADEHPRPNSTLEKLASLRPVFSKDGVVTAANASGICDGAGTVLLASERACREHDLKPLARVVSYGVTGCDPKIMGIGPVGAIRLALRRADLELEKDVDRVEINEAFAAQFLACARELDLDLSKTNIHGGALSLGHPLGASGSRILAHLANEYTYAPQNSKIHVGAACIGGGQGIAVVLERV